MIKISELSVFFPAYNEDLRVATTVERALKILPKVADEWEVLIVNDGSTDNTGEIINQ